MINVRTLLLKPIVTVLGVACVAAACASHPSLAPSEPDAPPMPVVVRSLEPSAYGSFLAARYAGALGEGRAEAVYYRDALARARNQPILIEHAFISAVSNGHVEAAEALAKPALKHPPTEALARLVLAGKALREGKNRQAVKTLEGLDLGPFNRVMGAMMLAWAHAGVGDVERALEALDGPADAPELVLLTLIPRALILDRAGRSLQAESAYRAALSTGVLKSLSVDVYGRFLERAGRTDEAFALYVTQTRYDPQDPSASAGIRRLQAGEPAPALPASAAQGASLAVYGPSQAVAANVSPDLAIIYLRLALAVDPTNVRARGLLGGLLDRGGETERALAVFEARDGGGGAALQVAEAWVLSELGREAEAVTAMEAAAAGGDRLARMALGDLYAILERFDDAEALYTSLIEQTPGPASSSKVSSGFLASQAASGVRWAAAGDVWLAHFQRGLVRQRLDRWSEAEADMLIALDYAPDNPEIMNHLGYSWLERGERLEDAFLMIRQALDLAPNNGAIVDSLGWAYFQMAEYDTAVRYLERAVALLPQDPVINDHLGDAYWRTGREREAGFQWARVLTLQPSPDLREAVIQKAANGLPDRIARVASNP